MAAEQPMFAESDFELLKQEYAKYDEQREVIIKRSRDIQKSSKMAIFSLHRNESAKAQKLLSSAEEGAKELLPMITQEPGLRHGSFSNALEEYVEARIFLHWQLNGVLLGWKSIELPVDKEEYLGGLLDFTGELNRVCVQKATQRDIDEVKKCRDLVDAIMGQMLQFDLRNGTIRKKYDGLKYVLKNMENQIYELSLFAGKGLTRQREDVTAEAEEKE